MLTKKMKLITKTETNGQKLTLIFATDVKNENNQATASEAVTVQVNDTEISNLYNTGKDYTISIS